MEVKDLEDLIRDIEEIKEILKCDAPIEIKLKMISNVVYSKPHYFKMMTNGEVIKAVFPKAKVDRYIDEYGRSSDYLIYIDDETYFTKEWWNALYKEGAE